MHSPKATYVLLYISHTLVLRTIMQFMPKPGGGANGMAGQASREAGQEKARVHKVNSRTVIA